MARTQTVSDDEIFEAARRVIFRSGYDAFTLSDVAEEVGLSRAAIILRFQSTRMLKLRLTERMVAEFVRRIEALPLRRGGDGLLDIARLIVGNSNATRLQTSMGRFRKNSDDMEFVVLENQLSEAFHKAIALRMPKTAIATDAAVRSFRAHLGGTIMQWEMSSELDARVYVIDRTKEWLQLAHIPFDKRAPELAETAPKAGTATRATKPEPARRKAVKSRTA